MGGCKDLHSLRNLDPLFTEQLHLGPNHVCVEHSSLHTHQALTNLFFFYLRLSSKRRTAHGFMRPTQTDGLFHVLNEQWSATLH